MPRGARPAPFPRVPHRHEQRRHGAAPGVELRWRLLPLSLLEFACFEAAFSECLQFSEQSGRNCIEVAYLSDIADRTYRSENDNPLL